MDLPHKSECSIACQMQCLSGEEAPFPFDTLVLVLSSQDQFAMNPTLQSLESNFSLVLHMAHVFIRILSILKYFSLYLRYIYFLKIYIIYIVYNTHTPLDGVFGWSLDGDIIQSVLIKSSHKSRPDLGEGHTLTQRKHNL